MRSAITVSLVPAAKGGPFVFWDGLPAAAAEAARLGFDGLEIFPVSAAEFDAVALRALLDRFKLRVAAFGTGGGWLVRKLTLTHADAAVRREAREFIRAIVDLAGSFGAPAIIGSMQGRWEGTSTREHALGWLGEALDELGAQAARHGVPLLYEPLNRYETNLFNRIGDAAGWLRTLPGKNLRVLADLYHMNIEETDLAAALREAGPLVGHVHFADSNRRAIGFGHTDVAPIVAALRAIDYQGFLSAEILPLPDSNAAARQTMAAFRAHTGLS